MDGTLEMTGNVTDMPLAPREMSAKVAFITWG
ncbi:Hypothetical protein BROD_0476 [Brucella sp. NF 2653]|nr:hypothetical protein BM590_A2103 [Brucella melitensis M5-90]EFM57925.1 Hypothetical protein BIBO1_0187 [Brucella inopinata BO1]EFM63440.1 Hypothetical protein BROD_0476 [Brucella sp. NF 2653]EPZ76052.1 hypothetical protein M798_08235 [Brucella melitensis ADMAS-G1]ERM05277.1 hypothetical protein P408_08215 [Brucella abortus S99]ERM86582.1 hypothetical protein P865_07780 [Brucella abortus 82]EXU83268.1 hypothetical protein AX23_07040 [Brucella melitensis 548]